MRLANNQCKWLMVGKTNTCGKKCVYDYCGHHRINIRKTGFEPQPCRNCGVGTKSKSRLCCSKECGGRRASQKYIDIEKTARRRFGKLLKQIQTFECNQLNHI